MRNTLKTITGITILLIGIGLLVWMGVGQYIAQINYDGVYINWRIVPDISQIGWLGVVFFFVGLGILTIDDRD